MTRGLRNLYLIIALPQNNPGELRDEVGMEKKKILFMIAHLGNGGAERVSTELADEMARRGHDVSAIVFDSSFSEYKLESNVHVEFLTKGNGLFAFLQRSRELNEKVKSINPEYIIELGFAERYMSFTGIHKKYKVITSCRNDPASYCSDGIINKLWKIQRDLYQKRTYKMVFQTEDAKEYFDSNIQKKSKVIVNPIKEDLPDRYIGKRDNRVVAFSRLNKQKNIPMLLRAFAEFVQEHEEYTLEIYGRGEEMENLVYESERLGISDKVKFCGFCANIHERILSARMYVSSSDYEGISNSMLEALAIGLPCICTDCPAGGARMVIENNVSGILIPVGDQKSLTTKMLLLAENDDLVESLSKNAVQIRNKLSIANITEEWLSLMA